MDSRANLSQLDQRVGDQLVRLVQIVFALVVTQSLVLYRDVVIAPLSGRYYVAALALVNVYVMTVYSWVDWHRTVAIYPYNLSFYGGRRVAEFLKLAIDLAIVTIYAYVLFAVDVVRNAADASMAKYLWGYVLIYTMYLAAGRVRSWAARSTASNYRPIIMFLGAFVVLAAIYRRLPSPAPIDLSGRRGNVAALLVVLVLTVSYRIYRTHFSQTKTNARKNAGLRVGIDVDGVLADQIEGILPRIKARLGIFVSSREQVTDWALPLGESDIAREINSAIAGDTEYVRDMQPHSGAQDVIREVFRENKVVIVTARPASVQELTKAWLGDNGLPYDEIISTKEGKKSLHELDVLVDDHLGNVVEVLGNSDGVGILMDQPWNREGREVLDKWEEEGRAFIVTDLSQILPIIRYLRVLKKMEAKAELEDGSGK